MRFDGYGAVTSNMQNCVLERPYRVLALPKPKGRQSSEDAVGAHHRRDGIKSLRSAWRSIPFKTVSVVTHRPVRVKFGIGLSTALLTGGIAWRMKL